MCGAQTTHLGWYKLNIPVKKIYNKMKNSADLYKEREAGTSLIQSSWGTSPTNVFMPN